MGIFLPGPTVVASLDALVSGLTKMHALKPWKYNLTLSRLLAHEAS